MRRCPIPAVFAFFLFLMGFCAFAHAATFEFHGGFYSSYEFTDNYFGTPINEESESTYEIGPSAQLLCRSENATLDLSGHAARSFHRKYDEDNFNEILLNSLYSTSTVRDTIELGYGYNQSSRRSSLSDLTGNSKIHNGLLNYSRTLSSASTFRFGYTYTQEQNPSPDEDIVSQGFVGSLAYQLSPRNSIRFSQGYSVHDYDISADAWELRSALGFETQVTPRAGIGTDLEYEHHEREDQPDGDIYNALLSWGYSLTPSTSVRLSGGYSWLTMEGADREQSFAARGELTTRTQNDTLSIRVSREYTAEFTTDRYGTYDARSIYASWERTLLRDLMFQSNITYEERKPVSDVGFNAITGKEENITGVVSFNWTPLRYLSIRPSYEHLERIREVSDTVKENRYRIIAEVRY